ncbi:transposable element Tcb1 transposase [Trichonephila clavipes]|nr:transposable element Tcb1 transposase [Trichonephila clavipes]
MPPLKFAAPGRDFQTGQIVETRLAGANVTKSSQLLSVSKGMVSKISTVRQDKLSRAKSGRKEKLIERERWVLKRIAMPKKQATAAKATTELNQHQDSSLSTIAVRRHLCKQNAYGRAAISTPLVTGVNVKCRSRW